MCDMIEYEWTSHMEKKEQLTGHLFAALTWATQWIVAQEE